MTHNNDVRYVVITGHGRSGSNLLLDVLDQHENTFCRNEPNALVGGAFSQLPDPLLDSRIPRDFHAHWKLAISRSRSHVGTRDRFNYSAKLYAKHGVLANTYRSLISSRRFRTVLSRFCDAFSSEEFPCSNLIFDHQKQHTALPVLKLLLCPAWICNSHRLDHEQLVLHVIRRPEQFLSSWRNRYVANTPHGPERVFYDNLPSVRAIMNHFNVHPVDLESYSEIALLESELWRWRYINETLLSTLSASNRYRVVSYDCLMSRRITSSKRIFDWLGLRWRDVHHHRIDNMPNTLFKSRHTRHLEDHTIRTVIDKVLSGSDYSEQLRNPAQLSLSS